LKKIFMLAITALLSVGLLTACGGAPAQNVTVRMGVDGAMAFDPVNLTADAGDIKVTLVNADPSQPHSFTIPALYVKSKQVPAGKTDSVTIKGAKAGQTYDIICDTPGHQDGGMVGKLIIK